MDSVRCRVDGDDWRQTLFIDTLTVTDTEMMLSSSAEWLTIHCYVDDSCLTSVFKCSHPQIRMWRQLPWKQLLLLCYGVYSFILRSVLCL